VREETNTMKKHSMVLLALLGSTALAGCQFNARDAKAYSDETEKVLASKKDEIKKCYDAILKKDKKAAGIVAVTFTVEAETGAIKDQKVDEKKTTAPKNVAACVVDNMNGLKLDPPDKRDGIASFEYEFVAKEAKK
jgi:outer membrane murein-binding lipoprotein Lpp